MTHPPPMKPTSSPFTSEDAPYTEMTRAQWFAYMQEHWAQGEHVVILGPTGSGKTWLASDFVGIRRYVCVLAVKRQDSTLERFKRLRYHVIKAWPPEYGYKRVVFWAKPDSIHAVGLAAQSGKIAAALDAMYISGGWCVYFDEAGYIASQLKLSIELGVLLNQGRSSHLSVVCAMTRPHSVVGKIPLETLNQARHTIVFSYRDRHEIESCAKIVGVAPSFMIQLFQELHNRDFLYFGKDEVILVRS